MCGQGATGANLTLTVSEPALIFSDGQWYSYSGGEWYAFDDGAWYSLSDAAQWLPSDGYTSGAYDYGQSYADQSPLADSEYDVYAFEWSVAPYYEITLYSTDGVNWYSAQGDTAFVWTPVATIDNPTLWIPIAALDDSSNYGDSSSYGYGVY